MTTYAVYGVYANYADAPSAIQSMLSTDLPYSNLSLVLPYGGEMAASGQEWMKMGNLNYQHPPQYGELLVSGPLTGALSSGRSLSEVLAQLGLPRRRAEEYVNSLAAGQPMLVLYCGDTRQAAVLESALQDSGAMLTASNRESESYYSESDRNPHYYRESDLLQIEVGRRGKARTGGGAA
jgi:hypothetical protein